jgi:cytochrome c biogenesis factor
MLLLFFSFFGVGSNLLIRGKANTIAEFFIPWLCGLMVYAAISLSSKGDRSLNLVALGCFLIYLLTIVGNFIVRSDLMKKKKQYADEVSALKNYFSGIVHLTH